MKIKLYDVTTIKYYKLFLDSNYDKNKLFYNNQMCLLLLLSN